MKVENLIKANKTLLGVGREILKGIKKPLITIRAAQYNKEIKDYILKKINNKTKFI